MITPSRRALGYGNDLLREPREQAQWLPNDSLNDSFLQTPHLRDVNPIRC